MQNEEHNDPVWKLLGKARPVEVDPFFAQKTVREARRLEESRGGLSKFFSSTGNWLTLPRLTAAAAVLAITAFAAMQLTDSGKPAGTPPVAEADHSPGSAPDEEKIEALVEIYSAEPADGLVDPLESIDYLDNLVAVQDAAQLSDKDIANLLF